MRHLAPAMKPFFRSALLCLVLFAVVAARADSTTTAVVNAAKFLDQPNYSWSATIIDDKRSSSLDCKTEIGGLTLVNLPMNQIMRRALGYHGDGENQITAVFNGDDTCVIKAASGWVKPKDISIPAGAVRSGRRRGGGIFGSSYEVQFTISHPHEEVAIIIANYTDLKDDGKVISGHLSEAGARLLMVKPGQKQFTARKAAGSFRLWIREGKLETYEIELEGTIANTDRSGTKEFPVHQSITTELKDVGKTKFEVPEAAKLKLGF